VLAGGLVAGTFDIVYACTFWAVKRDVPPERIFQSVASGLLGKASFEGGLERPVPLGAAYGLLLYVLMNYIVLPLSAAGPASTDPLWIGLSIAVHAFLIGMPIALFARRALTAAGSPMAAGRA
jgi:hypothetical protein